MSAKFTPGPWHANWTRLNGKAIGFHVADETHGSIRPICEFYDGTEAMPPEEVEANARRLVACWNACEGMTADELEEIARTGGMLGPREDVAKIAEQRDELREALQALVDAAWLEDSHAVRFDGTVMFSPGYDFSGIDGGRRAEFREEGIEFVVWPAGDAGGNWSAYSTYEGSLWFELFETEDEAREQCMKLLDQVMPDHPISKARAALAATGEPQ